MNTQLLIRLITITVGLTGLGLLGSSCSSSNSSTSSSSSVLACQLTSDCPLGFECLDMQCIAQPRCVDAGCSCTLDQECADTLICIDQTCQEAECNQTQDCSIGETCLKGRCLTDLNADTDRDGIPDGSSEMPIDNCRSQVNPDQIDTDQDAL